MSGLPVPVAPPSSSAGSTSPYGLTDGWGSQTINLTGFPAGVMQALIKAGLDTSVPQTGDAIAGALAKIPDRGVVAQVQQMLFYGGFYGSGVTNLSDLQLGRFQSADVDALKNLVQTGGQTGQPLGSYLVGAANYGQASGTIKQLSTLVTPTAIPAQADEDQAIQAAASKLLGHAATSTEVAGFRGVVDQLFTARTAQANALAQQDPEQVGEAAGRLGEPGYFGTPQEAPPTPAAPFYLAKPGGPSQPQPGVNVQGRGISGQVNPNAAADNAADYYNQHTSDQNTIGQFTTQAGTDATDAALPTSSTDLEGQAEQFLQDRYGSEIANQQALTKYGQLLSFMRGTGQ